MKHWFSVYDTNSKLNSFDPTLLLYNKCSDYMINQEIVIKPQGPLCSSPGLHRVIIKQGFWIKWSEIKEKKKSYEILSLKGS